MGCLLAPNTRGKRRIARNQAARQQICAGHIRQGLNTREGSPYAIQRFRRARHLVAERFGGQIVSRPNRRIAAACVAYDLIAGGGRKYRVENCSER